MLDHKKYHCSIPQLTNGKLDQDNIFIVHSM